MNERAGDPAFYFARRDAQAGCTADRGDAAWIYVHGGPDKAILIVTMEGIEELKAAGFDLYPGALGENVTTEGLDRRTVRFGQRYRLGSDVIVEITTLRRPCINLEPYSPYLGHAIYDAQCKAGDTASARWGLGGFYARISRPGPLYPGAPVILLDQDA